MFCRVQPTDQHAVRHAVRQTGWILERRRGKWRGKNYPLRRLLSWLEEYMSYVLRSADPPGKKTLRPAGRNPSERVLAFGAYDVVLGAGFFWTIPTDGLDVHAVELAPSSSSGPEKGVGYTRFSHHPVNPTWSTHSTVGISYIYSLHYLPDVLGKRIKSFWRVHDLLIL